MRLADDLRSISQLAGDAVEQLAKLVQNEATLAKAELSAKVGEAGKAIGFLLAAALFATPAIVMLLMALAQWMIENGWSSAGAYLIAGLVALAIGGVLAMVGIMKFKSWSPAPTVTVAEIQRDVSVAKELVR